MLVLSTRLHDKITFPDIDTIIEVVAMQSGTVRLGIDAPEKVRVLRDALPDRATEWGQDAPATLHQLNRLVEKRLEITRQGLDEMRQHLQGGRTEDAEALLEKIDEDLLMLRRRVRREVEDMMQTAREQTIPPVCRQR
jgi:carbon storage regulator CsrA